MQDLAYPGTTLACPVPRVPCFNGQQAAALHPTAHHCLQNTIWALLNQAVPHGPYSLLGQVLRSPTHDLRWVFHSLQVLGCFPADWLCNKPVSFFGSFPCAWIGGSAWVPEGIPRCHHGAAGAGSGHPACNCRARGSCRLELCLEETAHSWAALEKQVSRWHVHGLKCHFVSHLQVWYGGILGGSAVVRTLAEIRQHAFKLLRLVFTYGQEQASSSLLAAAWL